MESKKELTDEEKKTLELLKKTLDDTAQKGTYLNGVHKPGSKIRSVRGKKKREYEVGLDGSLRRI